MAVPTNTQFAVAIHVLTYLAGVPSGSPVTSDELSESTNVTPVYIRRVMGPLRAAGMVRSRPGASGGWELSAAAEQINVADVWRLLQGDNHVLGLHGPDPTCATGRSVQGSLLVLDRAVADAVDAELRQFTVQNLLAAKGSGSALLPSPEGRA